MNVELIAHTQLSEKFINKLSHMFPIDDGIDPNVTDGQLVALTAIRNCYSATPPSQIIPKEYNKYFKKKAKDGGVGTDAERLFRQIFHSGHCHDEKTKVLTKRGYVLFSSLNDDDLIAEFNNEGKFIDFTKKWNLINHKYTGEMYISKTQGTDFIVTGGHRLMYTTRNCKKLRVDTATNLFKRKEFRVPSTALKPIVKKREFNSNYLKLAGMFIGDGCRDGIFHLKKERKIEYIKNLGYKVNIKKQKNGTVKIYMDLPFDINSFYNKQHKKIIPNELMNISTEEFKDLLDGLMNSDGNHDTLRNLYIYSTSSEELLQQLEILLSIHGYPYSVDYNKNYLSCQNKNWDSNYRVIIKSHRKNMPFVKDARWESPSSGGNTKNVYKKINVKNKLVYCVEVPNGYIMTSRNNKTLLSHNCSTTEHITFTFAIEDVSRTLLAQLTRHRVGFSFSVESQRYCRLGSNDKSGGADFYIPDIVKNNPEALEVYEQALQQSQDNYDKLRSLGVSPEESREVLPNATFTDIVMTVNLRSLLDFYSKRQHGKGAQSEIADLAEELRNAVIEVEPWTNQFFEETK